MGRPKKTVKSGRTEPPASFVVESTEQLRALSDPLRQRLLEAFAEPRTVKQAALRLGEPVSKLYHHVDLLAASGLLKVIGEERKRAAVERTFVVAARRIVVSPIAFGGNTVAPKKREALVRKAVDDVLAGAAGTKGSLRFMRLTARLSPEAVEQIECEISRLARELSNDDSPKAEMMLVIAVRAPDRFIR